jgi:membrane peptidoglycan carboxypeptidase
VSGAASVPGAGRPGQGAPTTVQGSHRQPGMDDRTAIARGAAGRSPSAAGWDRDDVISNPGPGGGRAARPADSAKKLKRRKRRRMIATISGFTILALMVAAVGAGYALVQVPLPTIGARPQTTTFYYSDGKTVMATHATENREDVSIKKVPVAVQHAVITAEDRTFYSNKGISVTGLGRAVTGLLTGQDKGGGSTITQQYIKNQFLTQQRSFARKAKEIPMAIKADRTFSKDQILELYLNTIFFGRHSYGIQLAAKAYYNKDVSQLTPEEGVVIASVIKDPTNFDPAVNLASAQSRWKYILSAMADAGWYPKEKLATAQYPKPVIPKKFDWQKGQNGILAFAVEKEVLQRLHERLGIPANDDAAAQKALNEGGYKVITTVDLGLQSKAVNAAAGPLKLPDIPKSDTDLDSSLVAVQPGTGKIVAYYGGKGDYGQNDMASKKNPHFPGSSMKPYVLATAIDDGISIKSRWDGTSPRAFADRPGNPLKNAGNIQCARCTLIEATAKSLNTTYYALTDRVGAGKARDTAAAAGITELGKKGASDGFKPIPIAEAHPDNRIGIGAYEIPVVDQAAGFATFADGGVYHAPYFVDKILGPNNTPVYDHKASAGKRAFSEDAAKDAGFAMQQVIVHTPSAQLANGRPAAGKTGTHDYNNTKFNSNVWMCGFTPQIAAAVWVGHRSGEGPIKFSSGVNIGSAYTAKLWKTFMDDALQGQDAKSLPAPVYHGSVDAGEFKDPVIPAPTDSFPSTQTSPVPSFLPTQGPGDGNPDPQPSQEPSPSVDPGQSPLPSFPPTIPSHSPRPRPGQGLVP